ncbi:MAG: alpha-ketoglutarate-dependent dioxygenase AlkB [Roseivirga sp.]
MFGGMKLPLNCEIEYLSEFLSKIESEQLYHTLLNEYHLDKARLIVDVGGRKIETNSYKILFATERVIAQKVYVESVHGKVFKWAGLMQEIRERIEQFTGRAYEVAMCIYYQDGNSFAPYHFDIETSGFKTVLPSLSLGAERQFSFKESDTGEVYSLNLENGSLLVMADYCQQRYTHSLPKDENCKAGRINITFREPSFV